MKTKRSGHACAKMISNGRVIFVVAGGYDGASILDSVEILDPMLAQGWTLGMYNSRFANYEFITK